MDLASLHAAVPAAEEEDLLEQVAVEAWTRDRDALLDALDGARFLAPPAPVAPDAVLSDVALTVDPAPATPAPDETPDPLSDGQVLGLVEHLLGAEVVSVELDPVQRLS